MLWNPVMKSKSQNIKISISIHAEYNQWMSLLKKKLLSWISCQHTSLSMKKMIDWFIIRGKRARKGFKHRKIVQIEEKILFRRRWENGIWMGENEESFIFSPTYSGSKHDDLRPMIHIEEEKKNSSLKM